MKLENEELVYLLSVVDGSGSDTEIEAIKKLGLHANNVPNLFYKKYRLASKAKERGACVHYSTRYARDDQIAFELGLIALSDRSRHVRHLACLLLAWSLRADALPELRKLERFHSDDETLEDIRAAIDAIENQNSDYFVDRDHSGMVSLNIL